MLPGPPLGDDDWVPRIAHASEHAKALGIDQHDVIDALLWAKPAAMERLAEQLLAALADNPKRGKQTLGYIATHLADRYRYYANQQLPMPLALVLTFARLLAIDRYGGHAIKGVKAFARAVTIYRYNRAISVRDLAQQAGINHATAHSWLRDRLPAAAALSEARDAAQEAALASAPPCDHGVSEN
jgi:hypothetical protein